MRLQYPRNLTREGAQIDNLRGKEAENGNSCKESENINQAKCKRKKTNVDRNSSWNRSFSWSRSRRHFCFAIIHQSINELLFFCCVSVKSSSRAARKVRVLWRAMESRQEDTQVNFPSFWMLMFTMHIKLNLFFL